MLSSGSFYESSISESNFREVEGSETFCFALAIMDVRAASVIPLYSPMSRMIFYRSRSPCQSEYSMSIIIEASSAS